MHIFIEYYDTEKKGLIGLEDEELKAYQKERMTVEVLSFTDEITGISFMEPQKIDFTKYYMSFSEVLRDNKDQGKRHYSIKYKSFITGDSVEEIKVIFNLSPDRFERVWYNKEEIPINNDFLSDITVENWHNLAKETYYNGDLVAVCIESQIHIVIPMVKS